MEREGLMYEMTDLTVGVLRLFCSEETFCDFT